MGNINLNFDIDYLKKVEQYILGALLSNNDVLKEDGYYKSAKDIMLKSGIKVSDFYRSEHQTIYKAMLKCWNKGMAVDLITISQFKPNDYKNNLTYGDGQAWDDYITELSTMVWTTANLEYHLLIMKEFILLRYWNGIANRISDTQWNDVDKIAFGDKIVNDYNGLWLRLTVNMQKI